jgi:hypothetical protein
VSPEQVKSLIRALEHPALEDAAKNLSLGKSALEIRAKLEQTFDTETCLAIMDCLSCRQRYSEKFWQPERWLLSREPAEQATDSRIARWRAEVLAESGRGDLMEMGCGLGGDSVFLSERFRVQALERCPARSELARYNLSQLGSNDAQVVNREVECSTLRGEVLFVDPARRNGSRISRPDQWHPPLKDVVACFRERRFRKVGVKCAPGLLDRELPEEPTTVFFVSIEGQLKEAFLVLAQNSEPKKVAVLINRDTSTPLTLSTRDQAIPITPPAIGSYLHNPDPAILRACALDHLADQLDAGIVHPKIGYLVGPKPCADRCASSFRIVDHFPLNWKILKKKLSSMEWSDYEYLGRGVPFGQPEVRKKLGRLKPKKGRPSNRGSVIIYRGDTEYTVVMGARS